MKLLGNSFRYMLMSVTFIGVTIAAILTQCAPYRVAPLYVSLLVMFLQTKASRVSFLLGGCNAAYYALVYYFLGLYGMALYSILAACPIQIFTYIRWRKRAYGHSALLKRLSPRQCAGWALSACAVWAALYGILTFFGSGHIVLDNSLAVIGTLSNIASLLYLIEFAYIQCIVQILNVILYIRMIDTDPRQWTFLIYTVYALSCAILSAIYMLRLYKEQQNEMKSQKERHCEETIGRRGNPFSQLTIDN